MKRSSFSPVIGLCNECNDGVKKPLGKKGVCSYHYKIPHKVHGIKQVSSKEAKNRDALKETYIEFDLITEHFCTGCGNPGNLSHSHLIPRNEAKELECDIENITYHCMITCHDIWESKNINKMRLLNDFEKNMSYIKRVRPMYYERLISRNNG